jgi:DNA replication protein DnaC
VGLSPVALISAAQVRQPPSIFDNDAVLTSALLDRLLHHAETVLIEGRSFRSKDKVEV